jgi:hypothetical protein
VSCIKQLHPNNRNKADIFTGEGGQKKKGKSKQKYVTASKEPTGIITSV